MHIEFAFATDDEVARLLKQATAAKDRKDWDAALTVLAEAKQAMLVSPVAYPAETWCKYPLYLQQAGRFTEAVAEFQFLLDDLERRARRDARLDDPNVGPKRQKLKYYRIIVRTDKRVIKDKMALAETRETKLKQRKGNAIQADKNEG